MVVELSRAEQWVVHHVLLDAIGLADGEPARPADVADEPGRSLAAIEKLESGSFRFTARELLLIERVCGEHAAETDAAADRNLASSIAERISLALSEASA